MVCKSYLFKIVVKEKYVNIVKEKLNGVCGYEIEPLFKDTVFIMYTTQKSYNKALEEFKTNYCKNVSKYYGDL